MSKLEWDWAGQVCRIPNELWVKVTAEWTPTIQKDLADLHGDGGMNWTFLEDWPMPWIESSGIGGRPLLSTWTERANKNCYLSYRMITEAHWLRGLGAMRCSSAWLRCSGSTRAPQNASGLTFSLARGAAVPFYIVLCKFFFYIRGVIVKCSQAIIP